MATSDRRRGVRQRVLSRSLLLTLPLWALGCIIPTPLEGEPAPNRSPVILGGTPDFTAGPVVSRAQDDVVLAVVAMDPDAGEALYAGLFYRLERDGEPPEAMELARAQLAFPEDLDGARGTDGEGGTAILAVPHACERLAAQQERDKLLHVYVTDRPLSAEFNPFRHTLPEDPWLQHSAHAQWVLNCL
jgi:hypothetical protein